MRYIVRLQYLTYCEGSLMKEEAKVKQQDSFFYWVQPL
mgnify:CR=1 FL=1